MCYVIDNNGTNYIIYGYVNKRARLVVAQPVPVYIPDFLRRFPRYRNLDNDPIIQYPGAVPLCQISWKLAKLASVLHRFDWLQRGRKEPSFTALADKSLRSLVEVVRRRTLSAVTCPTPID